VNDTLTEAFSSIEQSTRHRVKTLLVVCQDHFEWNRINDLLAGPDVEIFRAETSKEALAVSQGQHFDGIVINPPLEDATLPELVEKTQAALGPKTPPILILATSVNTQEEQLYLSRLSRTSVVRLAQSLDRLLDESVLLLHRDEADLNVDQRSIVERLRALDRTLFGKTVLVVDDDVRNIFALTSLLEEHNLNVVHAENGRAGIEILEKTPAIDLVLMDIMMPEMDGYETMNAIRQRPQFRSLPIIALTAKAMKGDRAKCIEAGASDYVTKPVDLEQLFSVLRVWIGQDREHLQAAVPNA